MRARMRLMAAGVSVVVLAGCASRPTRPAPAAGVTAVSRGVVATTSRAQPGWLERSGEATWHVVTFPMRALTPAPQKPQPAVVEQPDAPAELVLVPAHGGKAGERGKAETQP